MYSHLDYIVLLQVAAYEVLPIHPPTHYVVFFNELVLQSVGGVHQFVEVICMFMPIHANNFGNEHLACVVAHQVKRNN